MYCKYCGNKIPDGAEKCPACGYTVEEEPQKDVFVSEQPEPYKEPELENYEDEDHEETEPETEEYVPFKPLNIKDFYQTAYDQKGALSVQVAFWINMLVAGFFVFWTVFSWQRAGQFYTGLLTYIDTAVFVLLAAILSRILFSHIPAVIGCVLMAGNYLIARLFGGRTILVLAALMCLVYLAITLNGVKRARNYYNYCGLHSKDLPTPVPASEKTQGALRFLTGKQVLVGAACVVLTLGLIGGTFAVFAGRPAEIRFSPGTWKDKSYSNPYAGIEYQQEEGWTRYSDEKLYLYNAQTSGVFADPYKFQMVLGVNSNGYIQGDAYCEVYLAQDKSSIEVFLNDMLASFEANLKAADPSGKLERTSGEKTVNGREGSSAVFMVANGTQESKGETICFQIMVRRVERHIEAFVIYGSTEELIQDLLEGFTYTKS